MPLGSRLKPVMVRAEGWFTVFGRIGVIPSQLLRSCLGKIEIVTLKVIQGCFVIFRVQEGVLKCQHQLEWSDASGKRLMLSAFFRIRTVTPKKRDGITESLGEKKTFRKTAILACRIIIRLTVPILSLHLMTSCPPL